MTKDDIIRMAREVELQAGFKWCVNFIELERFAALVAAAEREKVAQWMMQRGYATGHGDTTEDLLQELDWQIAENWTRAMVNGAAAEREECAKVAEDHDRGTAGKSKVHGQRIAHKIRARDAS